MKMKRKDLDQFNDEFSDFSLSSPARKIRRLDVGLPPIIEEEEPPEIAVLSKEPFMPENYVVCGNGLRIEELPDASSASACAMEDRHFCDNQERAIVLFKQLNLPFLQSSPLSVSVDSDIISGLKSEILRENRYDGRLKFGENDDDDEMGTENKNMAVVPWVPRLQIPAPTNMNVSQEEAPQLMEAEELGEATMEIEDDNSSSQQSYTYGGNGNGMDGVNAIHQWHQQHCMIPQLPQQTSSPITWFR